MRRRYVTKTFTVEITYRVFEPGDRVRFIAGEEPGVFTVTRFHEPAHGEDVAVVFLDGYPWGVRAECVEDASTAD